MRIAAGFAVHTGWAQLVLVAGDLRQPIVLDRHRVALVPDDLPGAAYHAAQGLPLAEAERLVEKVHAAVEATAPAVLADIDELAREDGRLVAVGISGGPPRDVPELTKVLAAHNGIIQRHVDKWQGTVVKNQGDGFMLTFGGARRR